jgi:acetyltransferase-like isoleucine patch superfamily enzyme
VISGSLRWTVTRARIAYYRALSTTWFTGAPPQLHSPVLVLGPGRVHAIGATIGWWPTADLLDGHVHIQAGAPETEIVIGPGTNLNNRTKLLAEGPGIVIGRSVLVGRNTEIYDSDRHDLDPEHRDDGTPMMGAVVIEDNVFIGSGVKIGKGVCIGRDSVIGMGAVVVSDVPSGVVAAGNPCRVVRDL